MRAEAVVEADSSRDVDDVGADELADVRDLVDEADARREERVRGELHELGRSDVHRENVVAVELVVEPCDALAVLRLERADDDAVWVHEVVGSAFPSARNSGLET